jgi:isocitrate dehydrogenase
MYMQNYRSPEQAAVNRNQPTIENGPALAMVNSDKGITDLHVPSV